MNANVIEGKWKQVKGDAKIWWGQVIDDPALELEGNWQKLKGNLQEKKGLTQEAAQAEIEKFQKAKAKFADKVAQQQEEITAKWNKLTQQDVEEAGDSMEGLAEKIHQAYGIQQQEANEEVRTYVSGL